MRKVIDLQLKFGEVSIEDVEFDPRSRDEIPKLLQGLQSIYCDHQTREEVFEILEDIIPDDTDFNNGRPGMDLWRAYPELGGSVLKGI
jgi:IS5 family transposase